MIFTIIGKDRYLLKQELDIVKKSLEDRKLTFEVENFDATSSTFDIDAFFHATRTISFLTDTKLIILNGYNGINSNGKMTKDIELEFDRLIKNQSDVNVVIITEEKLDSRKKIVKSLQTQTKVIDVSSIDNEQVVLARLIKDYDISMDKDTALYFLEVIDHKAERMDSELQKLSLYNHVIEKHDIDLLVNASSDFLFYASELADALMKQQKTKLFEVYYELQLQRKKPIEIISTVAKSIRQVYQFNILYQRGYTLDQISAEIGISPKQGYRFKSVHLYRDLYPHMKYLNDLSSLDQKFKSGLIDQQLGFELFLVKAVNEWNH